jgi:hypothetical protein
MLTCLYHPTEKARVLDDESIEFKDCIDSGAWFRHPNDAKKMREKYERKILKEQGLHAKRRERGGNHQQPSEDGGDAA